MKITNRTVGKWQNWDEFVAPEHISNGTQIIVWSEKRQRCVTYTFIVDLWMAWIVGEMSADTDELMRKYDVFCIVQGPCNDQS